MAYSLIFNVPKFSANKFQSFRADTPIKPFSRWSMEEERKDVLFTYDVHHGPGICEHTMFIPDATGKSGSMLYVLNGDYVFIDVCAKVLIDANQKRLYISNIIVKYENIFSGEEKKFSGGMKAFKKLEDHQEIITNVVDAFFGDEWRFYLGYKKYHKKSYVKQNKRRIKMFDGIGALNADIYDVIADKMSEWNDVTHRVTCDDMKRMKQIALDNIGAENRYGRRYAWGSTVAVYNPLITV